MRLSEVNVEYGDLSITGDGSNVTISGCESGAHLVVLGMYGNVDENDFQGLVVGP